MYRGGEVEREEGREEGVEFLLCSVGSEVCVGCTGTGRWGREGRGAEVRTADTAHAVGELVYCNQMREEGMEHTVLFLGVRTLIVCNCECRCTVPTPNRYGVHTYSLYAGIFWWRPAKICKLL